jgi:hypothetical protein
VKKIGLTAARRYPQIFSGGRHGFCLLRDCVNYRLADARFEHRQPVDFNGTRSDGRIRFHDIKRNRIRLSGWCAIALAFAGILILN